ncbi:MAG: cysteine desulfurase NifS [Nitrospirae bacterium]|nr:cysteine desulfurase NifS [Nitrospirota bacterium]
MTPETIYLDNNATTCISLEVISEMMPYIKTLYGNPSSMHTFGSSIREKIEEARERVAYLIGAEPEEIVFTSCGTESDNTALMSAVDAYPHKKHIITTSVEHPAVLNFVSHLQKTKGFRVTYLPVDGKGNLDMDEFLNAISEETSIVSVMYANNETGVIFPLKEIAGIIREKSMEYGRKILFHTDAVQAVGKIPINVKELSSLDMLSISGHKLHAPKGIGALYVRKGMRFHPYIIGGHQENGMRAGTENTASIIGLGKACELASERLPDDDSYIGRLRDKLESSLLERCSPARINGDKERRLANTTNISFDYVSGEAILVKLNEHGICVSTGSACASGSGEPSHVLKAMSVPPEAIHGSIRFSLGRYNKEAEIDKVVKILPAIVNELREISPLSKC